MKECKLGIIIKLVLHLIIVNDASTGSDSQTSCAIISIKIKMYKDWHVTDF